MCIVTGAVERGLLHGYSIYSARPCALCQGAAGVPVECVRAAAMVYPCTFHQLWRLAGGWGGSRDPGGACYEIPLTIFFRFLGRFS